MHVLEEKLRAPELQVEHWLNLESNRLPENLTMADLRGKVVLIDFWDYTCINCIHTLPYLKEWHHRYARYGLVILGLHAPEFAFSREPELIAAGVDRFELSYPVATDNHFRTWNAYANRAWPAKYLIDKDGYIRAFHRGEGAYAEFEEAIQTLLREIEPGLDFPAPMKPVHDFDEPGALCERPTPELYLGYGRGELGNRLPDQAVDYPAPPNEQLMDTVYLEGPWFNAKEYIETIATENQAVARIHLNYSAASVNLVLNPTQEHPVPVRLLQDGEPLPEACWGADVERLDGNASLKIDSPRMFHLVRNPGFESHRLTLEFHTPGVRAYAFTFVSCASTDTALA